MKKFTQNIAAVAFSCACSLAANTNQTPSPAHVGLASMHAADTGHNVFKNTPGASVGAQFPQSPSQKQPGVQNKPGASFNTMPGQRPTAGVQNKPGASIGAQASKPAAQKQPGAQMPAEMAEKMNQMKEEHAKMLATRVAGGQH